MVCTCAGIQSTTQTGRQSPRLEPHGLRAVRLSMEVNTPWKLAAAIALLGRLQCVADAQQPPARQFARGVVLVDLRVGDAPGWALVDTGSPHTYVDVSLREALCGPMDGKPLPKTVQAKLWIAGKLSVRQDVRFLDLDSFNGSVAKQPLISILGRDLLGGYAFGIDVKRHRLRLWKGGNVPVDTIRRWAVGKDAAGYAVDVQLDRPPSNPGDEIVALDLGTSPESGAWTVEGAIGRAGRRRRSISTPVLLRRPFTGSRWHP